jgi:hypothetical protein
VRKDPALQVLSNWQRFNFPMKSVIAASAFVALVILLAIVSACPREDAAEYYDDLS